MSSNGYLRTSYHNYPPQFLNGGAPLVANTQINLYLNKAPISQYLAGGLPFPAPKTTGYLPSFSTGATSSWLQSNNNYSNGNQSPIDMFNPSSSNGYNLYPNGNNFQAQPYPVPPYVPYAGNNYGQQAYDNGYNPYGNGYIDEGFPLPPQLDVTTMAMGEEGGDGYTPPPLPSPPPTELPKRYAANESAIFWGDPHIVDADRTAKTNDRATSFDVTDAGLYNILEDKGIQFNAKFEKFPQWGPTVATEAGINLNGAKVLFTGDGTATVNGKTLAEGESVTLKDGSKVTKAGRVLKVSTDPTKGEYDLELTSVDSGAKKAGGTPICYIDAKVSTRSNGVAMDAVAPKGILGEGFDEDSVERKALKLGGADKYKADKLIADNPQILPPPPSPEPPFPPFLTTFAMGEEGGGGYNPPSNPEPPFLTTFAMGEEGGGGYNPSFPPQWYQG